MIRAFSRNGVEIRVLVHYGAADKKGVRKIDMVILSNCSPVNRMTEGQAMLDVIEKAVVGNVTNETWPTYSPDWSSLP